MTGTLYVVGTPIGNLEDITFRAVRILQEVDLIAAEDTRHTGKLLQHFQIKTPQTSYRDQNRSRRIPELLELMGRGKAIALVTDAGMPGISDPGYELVKASIDAGASVVPIPGPSACVTALSAAGLPAERFAFEGFLATKGKERRQRLEALQRESRAIVLYEAPHRLQQTLADLAEVLGGNRSLVLARELTKLHEEFWRGTIEEAIARYNCIGQPKGEFTLVIAGRQEDKAAAISELELKAELQDLLKRGMSRSEASRHLAAETAMPRRQIYKLALTVGKDEGFLA